MLRKRIQIAAEKSGRKFEDIKIIGASKQQSIENMQCQKNFVYAFAENYAQEILRKKEYLPNEKWHFIGPIQTNKIKKIIGIADLIHSVGRVKEAQEISKRALEKNLVQNILIEINSADESTKHGVSLQEAESFYNQIKTLPNLKVLGLMTMPPLFDSPERTRPYFKKIHVLADKLNLKELSMGTSNDFEVAIEEGATMIRLGEILFGPRPKK